MHSTWRAFLQSHNAIIENDKVIHFGDTKGKLNSPQNETIMVDLSHLGMICFSGDDAQTFLQNQLSCDVRKVTPHVAQYGSYCTPKGRILANFLLWQQDNYCMQLPAELVTAIQKRLSLFVLRSKVQITDNSDTWIRIGIAGYNARSLAEEIYGMKFDSDHHLSVIHNERVSVVCHPQSRFEFVTSLENAPILWKYLNEHAKPAAAIYWDWLEIRSGIPVISPSTQELFVPQMVNLDAIGGISFKKGCYPGQEIVARTQHLGKIKRRMYLANIATTTPVMEGDELFSSEMTDQSCGKIVNAAPSPYGGFDVLAVVQVKHIKAGEIHWQTHDGPILEFIPLPYSMN